MSSSTAGWMTSIRRRLAGDALDRHHVEHGRRARRWRARAVDQGDGAVVLRPQVAGEVVALGDELVPAVAVEAPAGVEQLGQPSRDGELGGGRSTWVCSTSASASRRP
jgi:hypothetical protein